MLSAVAWLSSCGTITLPAAVKMSNSEALMGTTTEVESAVAGKLCDGPSFLSRLLRMQKFLPHAS